MLDAEPLDEELREARLVPLSRRERTEHQIHPSFRLDGDVRTLARIARVELEIVRDTDPTIAPACPSLGTTLLEPVPVGEFDGAIESRPIVTAVVDDADGIPIRHGAGGHEVPATEREAVEPVPARGEVDQPLDHEHDLGAP